jgi:hypothetical protein
MPGAIGAAGAAAAYRTATAGGPAEAANSFGAVMQRALEQAVEVGRQSDATSTAALSGQGGWDEASGKDTAGGGAGSGAHGGGSQ